MPERTDTARRFAIPMAQGKLSLHFGHCESFAIIDVDDGQVTGREDAKRPTTCRGFCPSGSPSAE